MVETSSRAHSDSTSSLDIWNAFYFHIKDGMKASETAVKTCLHQKPFSAPRWKDKLSKLSEFAWRETKSGCFRLQTSSIWPLPSRLWKQFYCRSARDRREGEWFGGAEKDRFPFILQFCPFNLFSPSPISPADCIVTVMWLLRRM